MGTQKMQISDFQGATGGEVAVPIPDNQWTIELTGWQHHVWAAHQISVAGFAIGIIPSETDEQDVKQTHLYDSSSQFCNIIKMRKTGDVANINVFALVFIIVVCSFLVVVDLVLLRGLIFLNTFRKSLSPAIDRWIQEDVYHLQRRVYEALREGSWINTEKEIPVTREDTILSDLSAGKQVGATEVTNKYPEQPILGRSKTW